MKYVSNQRRLHNVEVTLSIHIYLGAPSLAITCASTLQIRYNGHNSRPQDGELDKIQNTSRTNAKFQLDKYKIPTTGSLIDWARPLHTSLHPKSSEAKIQPGSFLGAAVADGIREILWQQKSENLTTCRRSWTRWAPTFSQEKLCQTMIFWEKLKKYDYTTHKKTD